MIGVTGAEPLSGLEVTRLSVHAQQGTVKTLLVDDVSFAAPAGQTVGIVGETGAGKTLTVRAVAGLLPLRVHATGHLRIGPDAEADLDSESAMARIRGKKVGIVLQNPIAMFDPLMRIGRQIIEGVVLRKLYSADRAIERAAALFASLGLSELVLDLYPHQLSGGMSQRAAIAMALMSRPSVLVADEPTTALDANLRLEVLSLLGLVARDFDTSVILVSHDLGLVSHVCDTVVVMYAGRILEEGPTQDVLRTPQHPYTAALLSSSTTLDATPRRRLSVIPGQPPEPTDWPAACVFEPRCRHRFDLCAARRPVLHVDGSHAAACHLAFGAPAGFREDVERR
jgi:oligopeptide/dipeptide ABC transporter ATP-binding protein